MKILACGSAGYLAPEMCNKTGYDCKVDIFSLGIILFAVYIFIITIRLTGEKVFKGASFKELLRKNIECEICFTGPMWLKVTSEAKDLTQRMTEKKANLRISAKDALDHPWFTLEHTSSNKLSLPQVNIKKYCNGEYFNLENRKPDFCTAKNSSATRLKELAPIDCSLKLFPKNNLSSNFVTFNSKSDEDSHGSIESVLRKLKISKRHQFSNKVKLLPIPCTYDASNFEESDISEQGEVSSPCSINRVFMTKGIRGLTKSPEKRESEKRSELKNELNVNSKDTVLNISNAKFSATKRMTPKIKELQLSPTTCSSKEKTLPKHGDNFIEMVNEINLKKKELDPDEHPTTISADQQVLLNNTCKVLEKNDSVINENKN